MDDLPPEALNDPMRPPSTSVEVHCIHCGNEYESYLIAWREYAGKDGEIHGFWCCPMPGCDGAGFCFDIFPTDPDYVSETTGEKICYEDHEDDCQCDECQAMNEELEQMEAEFERRKAAGEVSEPQNSDDDIPF